jgi:hypothetical protein
MCNCASHPADNLVVFKERVWLCMCFCSVLSAIDAHWDADGVLALGPLAPKSIGNLFGATDWSSGDAANANTTSPFVTFDSAPTPFTESTRAPVRLFFIFSNPSRISRCTGPIVMVIRAQWFCRPSTSWICSHRAFPTHWDFHVFMPRMSNDQTSGSCERCSPDDRADGCSERSYVIGTTRCS